MYDNKDVVEELTVKLQKCISTRAYTTYVKNIICISRHKKEHLEKTYKWKK